jgi:quercetin dioxygenase-like cupin family protein
MELKITHWPHETPPTEEELLEFFTNQDMRVYRWSDGPEHTHEGHTHGYHKIVYVVKGSIKFDFPVRHKIITLNPGDRLDLPSGIRHAAVSGPDGVTCLEAHVV